MKIQGWKHVIVFIMMVVMVSAAPVCVSAEEATDVAVPQTEQAQTENTTDIVVSENTTETVQSVETQQAAGKKTAVKAASKKTSKKSEKAYTKAELRLMSALIFCEAGSEPYNGKLAVGIVVMNRKRSSKYPDTLKGVIYQKFQFSPVRSGALSRALKQYDAGKFTTKNHKDCIKAAKEALKGCTKVSIKGKKVSMKKYLFFSVGLRGSKLKIANHRFK